MSTKVIIQSVGVQGPPGAQGPPGPQGPQGPQGVPGEVSQAQLNAHTTALSDVHGVRAGQVAGDAGLAFERMRNVTLTAIGTDPVPVDGIGEWIYGSKSGLWRTNDEGATWTQITDTFGGVSGVRPTADGEVIVVTSTALHRSDGWSDNPLTATFTSVLSAPGSSAFLPFSVSAEGSRVFATTYQAGDMPWAGSRLAWLSADNGATFTQVFDADDHSPDHTITHNHLCAIDPWADNRLWISWHGAGTRALMWSDDDGTTWTSIGEHQPTVGIATPNGMVFGTDEYPNRVMHVRRTDDPADMVVETGVRLRYGRSGTLIGFAAHGYRDENGVVLIAWQNHADIPALITASDGVRADIVLELGPTDSGNNQKIVRFGVANNRMMALYAPDGDVNTFTLRADVPLRGALGTDDLNSGGILRGDAQEENSLAAGSGAVAGQWSTAVGVNAKASAIRATVVGRNALAGENSTAHGQNASADGTHAMAIGHNSIANGNNRIAIGNSTTADVEDVVIGHGITGGQFSVIVSRAPTISGNGITAVGERVVATGSNLTPIGRRAEATAVKAAALGHLAKSHHARSVALGADTQTTAADQVMVGPRDIEITDFARGYIMPSPDGSRWRLTMANDGSLKTTKL